MRPDVRLLLWVSLRVGEALVMAEVEVGFGAVVGDEDFAVLKRAHRARIDVKVGIQFLQSDSQAAAFQQAADAGGSDTFPKEETTPPVTKIYLAMNTGGEERLQTVSRHAQSPLECRHPGIRIRFRQPEWDSRFQGPADCSRRSACSRGPTGRSE